MKLQLSFSKIYWPQVWGEVVAYAYVLLFVYAGVYKLLDYSFFREQLRMSPLIGFADHIIAWLIPTLEIGISLLLLREGSRSIGLWLASLLMAAFTLYIIFILWFSPMVPCSCGGILATMGWRDHLIMNLAFLMSGISVLWLSGKK